ncbi:hypothetical protein AAG906_039986 [Vitis piasezkii]
MDWTRGHTLGSGSSATVSLANSLRSGDVFAVKSVELSRSESLQREERILSSLRSPYIVGYKGCDITRENNKLMYNLFIEYMPGGTLGDAIRRGGGQLHESMIGIYARQIVQGLDYIHSRGLVHCDIKGQNVLIGEDGAKIADFGCAKWTNGKDDRKVPIAGTPFFMAPEVARGEDQGYPSDVWALGCTIIEMATGGAPWPNVANAVAALYRIGFSEELPWIPSFLSDQAKDFLSKCLRRDPKERWTASQLLKHPFVGELNPQAKQVQESYSDSPTSILDQNFWSSLEESEAQGYLKQASFSNSPAERIRKLWTFSRVENWTRDDNWVTIRGSTNEESNVPADYMEDEANPVSRSEAVSSSHDVEMVESHGDGEEMEDFLDSKFSCRTCMRDSVVVSNFNFEIDKEHLLITSTSISNFLAS